MQTVDSSAVPSHGWNLFELVWWAYPCHGEFVRACGLAWLLSRPVLRVYGGLWGLCRSLEPGSRVIFQRYALLFILCTHAPNHCDVTLCLWRKRCVSKAAAELSTISTTATSIIDHSMWPSMVSTMEE